MCAIFTFITAFLLCPIRDRNDVILSVNLDSSTFNAFGSFQICLFTDDTRQGIFPVQLSSQDYVHSVNRKLYSFRVNEWSASLATAYNLCNLPRQGPRGHTFAYVAFFLILNRFTFYAESVLRATFRNLLQECHQICSREKKIGTICLQCGVKKDLELNSTLWTLRQHLNVLWWACRLFEQHQTINFSAVPDTCCVIIPLSHLVHFTSVRAYRNYSWIRHNPANKNTHTQHSRTEMR